MVRPQPTILPLSPLHPIQAPQMWPFLGKRTIVSGKEFLVRYIHPLKFQNPTMILWFFVAWYTFQVPRILPINATTFQQTLVIFFILTAGDLPPLTWWVKLRCLQSTSAPSRGRCKGDSGSYHENFNQFSSHLKERMGDLNTSTFFMKATFKQEKTNILRRSKILVWFWFWWLWPISHACMLLVLV